MGGGVSMRDGMQDSTDPLHQFLTQYTQRDPTSDLSANGTVNRVEFFNH